MTAGVATRRKARTRKSWARIEQDGQVRTAFEPTKWPILDISNTENPGINSHEPGPDRKPDQNTNRNPDAKPAEEKNDEKVGDGGTEKEQERIEESIDKEVSEEKKVVEQENSLENEVKRRTKAGSRERGVPVQNPRDEVEEPREELHFQLDEELELPPPRNNTFTDAW
ncbi:jg19041 [Pararge aegeria aegeria]|uniref:Jg19041 protein n=1 Tax=Pararge aegeria aegeria TaxID=348720 RepID=A0A8S4R5P2_9NEOP|nr:jg19041 [Pararge aegeria aegeria]